MEARQVRNTFRCAKLARMPVAIADKVRALSQDFGSQRKLAQLLDVSPAQVTRWIRGKGIDDLNADRVDALEIVMSQLLRLYTPEVAAMWLRGLNPHLRDRRPIDLIRRGRTVEVLDAIQAARAGSYA
jgi:DNA-binding transcriptional regulator YdaS (Cro superfamily)